MKFTNILEIVSLFGTEFMNAQVTPLYNLECIKSTTMPQTSNLICSKKCMMKLKLIKSIPTGLLLLPTLQTASLISCIPKGEINNSLSWIIICFLDNSIHQLFFFLTKILFVQGYYHLFKLYQQNNCC